MGAMLQKLNLHFEICIKFSMFYAQFDLQKDEKFHLCEGPCSNVFEIKRYIRNVFKTALENFCIVKNQCSKAIFENFIKFTVAEFSCIIHMCIYVYNISNKKSTKKLASLQFIQHVIWRIIATSSLTVIII